MSSQEAICQMLLPGVGHQRSDRHPAGLALPLHGYSTIAAKVDQLGQPSKALHTPRHNTLPRFACNLKPRLASRTRAQPRVSPAFQPDCHEGLGSGRLEMFLPAAFEPKEGAPIEMGLWSRQDLISPR